MKIYTGDLITISRPTSEWRDGQPDRDGKTTFKWRNEYSQHGYLEEVIDVYGGFIKLWVHNGFYRRYELIYWALTPEDTVENHSRLSDHSDHGRGTEADGPDDCDCPCRSTNEERQCAAKGCGFCRALTPESAAAMGPGDSFELRRSKVRRSTNPSGTGR